MYYHKRWINPQLHSHSLLTSSLHCLISHSWCRDSQPDHNVTSACRICATAEPTGCGFISRVLLVAETCFLGAATHLLKPGTVLLLIWQRISISQSHDRTESSTWNVVMKHLSSSSLIKINLQHSFCLCEILISCLRKHKIWGCGEMSWFFAF